ncbi:MAG: N-acyl homoserine lactonase family protein [Halorientalis sp.]
MADLAVTAFNTSDWTFDYSQVVQMRGLGNEYTAKCPAYLIDHPEGTVLFDTGVSYEALDDPEAYGAPHMEAMGEMVTTTDDHRLTAQLDDAGYDPDDVDIVVLSHLHLDHAGEITQFPDAEFVVHQEELRYAWWPDRTQWTFYLENDFAPLRSYAYDVTVVEGEYDVFGDGSVVTVPTPGHTPGHQSLLLRSVEGQTVLLAADVAHVRDAYEKELCTAFNWAVDESVASIRTVRDLARTEDAQVAFLHDREDLATLADQPGIEVRDPSTD